MEEWKKAFDKAFPNRRTEFDADNRNSWGYVKNEEFIKGTSRHCFAGLCNVGAGSTHLLNGIQLITIDNDVVHLYLEWLLNYSPYSPIFITKDADKVMEEAVEVIDTKHPSNLIVGGMTASRTISEYPYIVNLWYNLVKRGVHPNLAFYYSHLFRCKSIDPKSIVICPTTYNHTAINANTETDHYSLNFYEGKQVKPTPLFSETGSYSFVQNLWDGKSHFSAQVRTTITNWFSTLKSKTLSSNPFAQKVLIKSNVMDEDMFLYDIVDLSHVVDFDYGIDKIAEFLNDGYRKVIAECPVKSVSLS